MEGLPIPQHSIQDYEKLAGDRDDGKLSRLSGSDEGFEERFEARRMADVARQTGVATTVAIGRMREAGMIRFGNGCPVAGSVRLREELKFPLRWASGTKATLA